MIQKLLYSFIISLSLLLPLSAHAQFFSCKSLIGEIAKAEKSQWDLDQNVFSSSLDTTMFWSSTWLSATQAAKSLAFENPFLSPSFLITLPMDVGLTLASHFFALESFSALHGLSKQKAFWARAAFNTGLGSLIIPAFWALFNGLHELGLTETSYNISPLTCLGAAGLCAVVYPSLQKSKNFLFKERPLALDQRRFEWLQKSFQIELHDLLEIMSTREQELNLSRNEISRLALLSNIIGSRPLELGVLKIENFLEDLKSQESLKAYHQRIKRIIQNLELTHDEMRSEVSGLKKFYLNFLKKDRLKLIEQKRIRLRHQLIQELLQLEIRGFKSDEIQKLLILDESFTSQQSLLFHRELQRIIQSRRLNTIAHSFLDQALAVGVAGGLFLYGVNQWAATGQTPWFIDWLWRGGLF
jgi:hypothetical protein